MDDRLTFATADGRAVPAVTAAEMAEVDRVAVDVVGLELLQMMEGAGRELAGFAIERAGGEPGEAPFVVLAGGGGNGGGGLCAARHLANHGRPVVAVLDRPRPALEGAAAAQASLLEATAVEVRDDPEESLPGDPALVVDALVGYSLRGQPRGRVAELIAAANDTSAGTAAPPPVVSLDVPTGVDATTGDIPGAAVAADATLTLALPKTGLAAVEGDLALADIGIPAGVYERVGLPVPDVFDEGFRVPLDPRSASKASG